MTAAKDEETLHRTKPGQRPVEESVGGAKGEGGGLVFFARRLTSSVLSPHPVSSSQVVLAKFDGGAGGRRQGKSCEKIAQAIAID